jgi:hypothetical protein
MRALIEELRAALPVTFESDDGKIPERCSLACSHRVVIP